jgi:signal transduction histidine kinase
MHQLQQRRRSLELQTQELDRSRREAEQASEAKSVFLANMSHEVRTPFHGLMGMLSILRETGLTPRQLDCLRTATKSADHLLDVLNDILDMSQPSGQEIADRPFRHHQLNLLLAAVSTYIPTELAVARCETAHSAVEFILHRMSVSGEGRLHSLQIRARF